MRESGGELMGNYSTTSRQEPRYLLNANYAQEGSLLAVSATCNSCLCIATGNNRIVAIEKIVHELSCAYALEDAANKAVR